MSEKDSYNKLAKEALDTNALPQDTDAIIIPDKVVDFLEKFLIFEDSINDWSITIEERLIGIEERQDKYDKEIEKLLKVIIDNKAETDSAKVSNTIFPTKTVTESNRTINSQLILKNTRGAGVINQLLLISESDNYTLHIMIDEYTVFREPYSYFLKISKHLKNDIEAIIIDKKYCLTIPNLQFKKRFKIQIIPTGSVCFNEIMLKYDIKDEKPYL